MQYLKQKCKKCGKQKLFDDSDGDGIDTPYEIWIRCENCEETYSIEELNIDLDGTLGFILPEQYLTEQ